MKKIAVIPSSIEMIKDNLADAYIIGLEDFSINLPIYFKIENIKEIEKIITENNKELFISLNKNIFNKEIEELKHILVELSKLNIKGILFYDISIIQLTKELNLKLNLVWSQEHFTTNYLTINYWSNFNVNSVRLSSEITTEEIEEIRKNTKVELMLPVFGYMPMFASLRPAISNYKNYFNLQDNSKTYYLEYKEELYPILENKKGTIAYNSKILNAYNEYKKLDIDYAILNSYKIDKTLFNQITTIFKKEKKENIEELIKNTTTGFLNQKTIYKVKK